MLLKKSLITGSGPDCSCLPSASSSNVTLSCSAVYADYNLHPIPAVFTWILNGKKYSTEVSKRDPRAFLVFANSTIAVDARTLNDYTCILTFGKATDFQYDYLAMNAPEFKDSCSTPSEF